MTVEEIFARFDGAYAESTIAVYRYDFEHFSRWCEEVGADPLNVSPEDLARFEDMELHPSGRAALHLRFSKTDQMGDGKLIPIGAELQEDLARWAERTGGSGYIVRRVYCSGDIGTAMAPCNVRRHVGDIQTRAGLELGGKLTAGSFRVGAALDLLERGVSMEKIMLRGGWDRTSSVMRYLRAWNAVR